MYLRKTPGPRAVRLDDGSLLTLADLPPPDTRWVASRKALVVNAVEHGLIARAQAIARYGLSEEEFDNWRDAISRHGLQGLRVTALQRYRGAAE